MPRSHEPANPTMTKFGLTDKSINHMLLTPRELKKEAFEMSVGGRNAELKKARRRVKVNMPGYTGHIRGFAAGPHWPHYSGRFHTGLGTDAGTERKHADIPFATPDNMYRKASARIKTNSKNHSAFTFGDDRDRFWDTTYLNEFTPPDGTIETLKEPIHDGWLELENEDRQKIYHRNYTFVGAEGTAELEKAIRTKIEQRTSGGPFALRKAFKYFDRDGSGDIDPDEFKDAMLHFGLTFTDRQVLAIFGTYDDDCSGSLDYYEFIDKVIESDYKSATGKKMSVRPRTPPRRMYPGQVTLYRQMLRLKEMFLFSDEDDTHALGEEELSDFLVECGHKEPDEDQVAEIMEALDRDKNGSISFEELWDWWVEYCMKAGTLHGTGLSPPVKEEWQLFNENVGGMGLAANLHSVVDLSGAVEKIKRDKMAENERQLAAIHNKSPRQLIQEARQSQFSATQPNLTPKPPDSKRVTLPDVRTPGRGTPRGTGPLRPAQPSGGNFMYKRPSGLAGVGSPRNAGALTARAAPRLSPLMRHRPLTHRGPATEYTGYKV